MDARHALAEAWASIDGKLEDFLAASPKFDPDGHHAGYLIEADEMIERLRRRGFDVVELP